MQKARIVQAVMLMMVLLFAAACTSSKQYVSKLFAPRAPVFKDTSLAVRFLELDSLENGREWVKTVFVQDSAMNKLPASSTQPVKPQDPVARKTKPIPVPDEPIAKNSIPETTMPVAGARIKRTRDQ